MGGSSRLFMMLAVGVLIGIGVVGFSMVNQDATATDDADARIVLHRGNFSEPSSLDPHRVSGTWEDRILGDIFLGLYTNDATAAPILGAAESHTVSDDGLVHTFIIRENHLWSDGVPVTAHDFVFALRRILSPEMAAQYASILYLIDNAYAINSGQTTDLTQLGVVALDDRTLEIHLNRPAPFLPQLLTHFTAFPVPVHVVEAEPDSWARAGTMVNNGPYVLDEWVPNDHVKVVRNELFYDNENVSIDEIYYYPTDDSATALRRFRAGELDMNADFPSQQFEWLQENLPAETHVSPYINTSYIAINTLRPPFDDVRIRRALVMAIDRDILAYQVMRTGQTPAYTLVPPLMPNYTPPQAFFADWPMERRIEEAQALMVEAGYGPDNPLQFIYRYRESIDNRRLAVATAGFWEEIYVDAELVNTESAIHYDDLRAGNYQVGDSGWIADYADAENYLFLLDSNSGQMNVTKYNNPEFDQLLAQAAQTVDLDERAAILARAEGIMLNDVPMMPTIYGVSKNLVGQQVVGWIDNPSDVHRTRFLSIDENLRDQQESFTDQIMRWFN